MYIALCSFTEFYSRIHRALALIPAVSEKYYHKKMTSTVITSLICLTPILAPPQFSDAYNFLREAQADVESIRLQEGLHKMLVMQAESHFSLRNSLLTLRNKLNLDAEYALNTWVLDYRPL